MSSFEIDYYAFLIQRLGELALFSEPREGPIWKLQTLKDALRAAWPRDGLVLELGVWKGNSLRLIAETLPDKDVYGFDSFEGFPEDGRVDWKMDLSRGGSLPAVPSNARLIKGYFDDTLPGFTEAHPGPVGLLHVDCDIYSSTRTIFRALRNQIVPGTVIIFDELINHRGFENNEILAFYEFLREAGLDFEWLACHGRVLDFTTYVTQFERTPTKFRLWLAKGFEHEVAVRVTAGKPSSKDAHTAHRIAEALAEMHPLQQPLRAA